MDTKEEASYWFKLSDKKYSEAMDLLEQSDEYYAKGKDILDAKKKGV